MATIVKNWITNKLGLEIPQNLDPFTFRYEVANGVLIAEILRKYGLLSDDEFVSLRHNNSTKTRVANMHHVHKWLTNAGMDLNEELMLDVAEEKPGYAVKFLYELFLWLEDGPRKPNVGDKAKKYLTDHRKITPKPLAEEEVHEQHRKSREERLSVLSSTWLHSAQAQEEGPRPEPEQQPDAFYGRDDGGDLHAKHPKGKLKKHPNWFTSLDSQEAFQFHNPYPYGELSEAAQAEATYFTLRTIEIFKDQEALKNEIRAIQRRKLDASGVIHDEARELHNAMEALTFRTQAEIESDRIYKAQEEARRHVEQEIKKFDDNLRRKNGYYQNGEPAPIDTGKIYHNGRGCRPHFRKSMQQLKFRRAKEVNAGLERIKRRQSALSKFIQEIPYSMDDHLQEEVLTLACTSLSTPEEVLADFIHFGHQEKSSLKEHAYQEVLQLQNARNLDLEKAVRIEQEEKDLKRALLEYKFEEPVKHEEIPDISQAEKVAIAEDIVENICELVDALVDYRSAMGSAESDFLFGDFMEAEDGKNLPKIVLFNEQKFVLELDPEHLEMIDTSFEDEYEYRGEHDYYNFVGG